MKQTILIVDDELINRVILSETFQDTYEIVEAVNGEEASARLAERNYVAVLLDLCMPEASGEKKSERTGLNVLKRLNESGRTLHMPVFIITAADEQDLLMEAYDSGAVDVIAKPFMTQFLKCRVNNVIELYQHRNDLESLVNEQVERLNAINLSMVETLAALIEFRDCESGEHVKRIRGLTEILMTAVSEMYPEYYLPQAEISKVVTASVLHDVGKIAIPDGILQKPGRLTQEEYEIMKQHTVKGSEILETIPDIMDNDIYDYSHDIARHHHERWDGRGYPDGLKGDEITIWSQVVAIADVYDALTSPRVYKAAFSHEKAVDMIFNNECGVFNPKVLEAFRRSESRIRQD